MGKYFDDAALAALDVLLEDVERQATDNDDLVAKLSQYQVEVSGSIAALSGLDPLSADYLEAVKEIHREIIGKSHVMSDEGLPVLNPDYERDWPYPWGTKSPGTVARFLIAYGFLIKTAALPAHARILEVGCGLGSLTWNLARMGYRVDALDPNEDQCRIVRAATRDFPVPPQVLAMSLDRWLDIKEAPYKYDAVIFFESFHHILDHRACLHAILERHLEADGCIFLAAEPVVAASGGRLPYPWGPRLDGESMRAMRRWGWLELGFTEDYLRRLFADLGLSFDSQQCEEALPWSKVIVGRSSTGNPANEADRSRYDASLEDGIQFSREGMPSFILDFGGLGAREPWGRWSVGDLVTFRFTAKLPPSFTVDIELADVFGPNVHKSLRVRAGNQTAVQTLKEIGAQRRYRFEFAAVDAKVLEIDIPHPSRPKDMIELGDEDPRRIGVAFVMLKIERR